MATAPRLASQWQCTAGSLQNLKLVREVPVDLPSDADPSTLRRSIVIAVHYVGLNFADMFAVLGLYSATPQGTFVPGLEFSGTVEAFCDPSLDATQEHPDYPGIAVGSEVLGVTRFGGYTTRIAADLRYVRALPKGWTLAEGAAFPCQALTAWYGLVELAALKQGQTALIHSAAGGTGLWALKICNHLGVKTIATVSSKAKADELMRLDPSLPRACIVVRDDIWLPNVRWRRGAASSPFHYALKAAMDARGVTSVNAVFDSLMGEWFQPSHDALGPQGRHIVLGAGAMTPHGDSPNYLKLAYQYLTRPKLDPLAMIATNKSVMAFNLIWLYESIDDVGRLFADLLNVACLLGPAHIGLTVPFEDAVEALHAFQLGGTVGKCLLKCTP